MGISSRVYIFAEDGTIKRVPQRVQSGLVFGEDAVPEYANTRQRIAHIILDNENGKPVRILDAQGSYWDFDEEGHIHTGLRLGAWEAIETYNAAARASRARIVDLRPKLKRKEWERKNRWDLSKDDLDRVAADIWPHLATEASEIQLVKGRAPKRPPLTSAAEDAISEANQAVFSIGLKIERLSDPALKGFAYEARRHAKMGENVAPLWEAMAAMADTQREILSRRRSGKGTWYALCHIHLWNDDHSEGQEVDTIEERCEGKAAALEAARRLLTQHAHKFSDNVTVEVQVLTDLEWASRDQESGTSPD